MRFFFVLFCFVLVKKFPTIPGVTLAIFAIHFPSIDIYLYIKQYVCYSANSLTSAKLIFVEPFAVFCFILTIHISYSLFMVVPIKVLVGYLGSCATAWRTLEVALTRKAGMLSKHHDEDCDVWLTYAVDVRTPSNSASRTISPLLTSMPIISKTTSKGKQGFPPDRISTATSFSVFCGLVLCRNHPFSLSPTITLIFKTSSAAML